MCISHEDPMDAQRVIADLRELAARTGTADGAQRLAWGPVWRDAREWFRGKVGELGLARGHRFGRQQLGDRARRVARTVIVGSHLDSVPNGGWLDGCLGVLAALEALRMHAGSDAAGDAEARRLGRRRRRALRAQPARIVGGGRQPEDRRRPRSDRSSRHAARRCAGGERRRARSRCSTRISELKTIDARAYLELHIEQGPVLESMNKSTGVVLGTFGVERHMLRFTGQAAHSGSTPIAMRRDAFLAAAQTALECREVARRHSTPGAGVVCTVGVVNVEPKIVTAVPGVCEISLDQRALDADVLAAMLRDARDAAAQAARRQQRHGRVAANSGASSRGRSIRRCCGCARKRCARKPATRRGCRQVRCTTRRKWCRTCRSS